MVAVERRRRRRVHVRVRTRPRRLRHVRRHRSVATARHRTRPGRITGIERQRLRSGRHRRPHRTDRRRYRHRPPRVTARPEVQRRAHIRPPELRIQQLEHRHRLRQRALAQLIEDARQQILRRRLGQRPRRRPPRHTCDATGDSAARRPCSATSPNSRSHPLTVDAAPTCSRCRSALGAARAVGHARRDDITRPAGTALAASVARPRKSAWWTDPQKHSASTNTFNRRGIRPSLRSGRPPARRRHATCRRSPGACPTTSRPDPNVSSMTTSAPPGPAPGFTSLLPSAMQTIAVALASPAASRRSRRRSGTCRGHGPCSPPRSTR